MKCNVVRALVGGGFEPIEVTKEGPGSGDTTMTVPELIGKQNVIAMRTAGDYTYGLRNFYCVPDAGGVSAFGYGTYGSYGAAYHKMETATYDPNTGKFYAYSRGVNYSDRWAGTFKFYAW